MHGSSGKKQTQTQKKNLRRRRCAQHYERRSIAAGCNVATNSHTGLLTVPILYRSFSSFHFFHFFHFFSPPPFLLLLVLLVLLLHLPSRFRAYFLSADIWFAV